MEDDDIDRLRMKSDQMTEDSLDSTRRMMQLCEETEDVGTTTLVALNEQGEQLDRIEEDLDVIHTDIREAEKNLTGMEKCCGLCVCPCKKIVADNSQAWSSNEDGKIISSQPAKVVVTNGVTTTAPAGGYIQKITNDAREDEMEDNMIQVSSMVGNLRNMAIDMGSELESQNKQIDRINLKAQSNETSIASANQRASVLLKK